MAQFITLEEAAERLGLATDDFKRRLKTEWTQLVPMRDGPTLRFRVNQIDELARQLGGASDPALPLAAELPDPRSDDFKVPPAMRTPTDEPLVFDSGDDDIFSLTADEPAGRGKPGDSDVRLEGAGPKKPAGGLTEDIALDLAGPGSAVIKGGSSAKLSAPKSGAKLSAPDSGKKLSGGDGNRSLANPGASSGDSSEFELSLDADSDDFELQLNADSSDEVDLGSSPVEPAGGGAKSGINLRDPKDSGIPLAGAGKPPPKSTADSDSDLDFELSLDPSPVETGRPAGLRGGPKPITSDSDSEFELTLDGSSGSGSLEAAAEGSAERARGDIFETDFEIPPMADESGSEAVAVDSDTDLEDPSGGVEVADDDTGSQVVALDDDSDVVVAPAEDEVAVEDDESVATALTGARRSAADEDDDEPVVVPGGAKSAAPAPWGPWPAVILFPALLLVTVGTLTGFEMVKSMTGYAQPRKPAAPLVRGIADTLDLGLKDQ